MALLLCSWIVLGGLALILGSALHANIDKPDSARQGNWLFESIWLGLVCVLLISVSVSFFAAVTPFHLALALLVPVIVSVVVDGRRLYLRLASTCTVENLLISILIVTSCGFIATGLRATPDTGDYHYPAIRWLAEFGTVPGVAHIVIRFGFVSGTSALLAPFDAVMPGRSAPVLNGLILCLLTGQIIMALSRIYARTARGSDFFICFGSGALVAIGVVFGFFTTNAPDPMVAALTVAAAWKMLDWCERNSAPGSIVPLFLTAGALNSKLSGLLLVPVAALFAVIGASTKRWVLVAVWSVILVCPYFISSFLTSGCLAVPAVQSCLDVPWGVPARLVTEIANELWAWSRWQSPMPPDAHPWGWLLRWFFATNGFWVHAVVFWPALIALVVWLIIVKGNMSRGEIWILVIISPSLILLFATAPDVRYNYGLFMIPIGLLFMQLAPRAAAIFLPDAGRDRVLLQSAGVFVGLLVVVALAIESRRPVPFQIVERLIFPRAAPLAETSIHQGNGFQYYQPLDLAKSGCWRSPLPCADRSLDDVDLLVPAKGIGGGFRSH